MTRSLQTLFGALALALAFSASADPLKVVKKVPPEFPPEAARKGITDGVLKANLSIDAGGAVTDVQIVEATPSKAKIFNDAAVEALKKWKFEAPGKATNYELKLVFQQD